jgi:hypothetical protein
VVGVYESGGKYYGFLWSGGTYTTLDVTGSTGTFTQGINNKDQVVGGYAKGGVDYSVEAAPTPEPGTLVSTASAFCLIVAWSWRRRRRPGRETIS